MIRVLVISCIVSLYCMSPLCGQLQFAINEPPQCQSSCWDYGNTTTCRDWAVARNLPDTPGEVVVYCPREGCSPNLQACASGDDKWQQVLGDPETWQVDARNLVCAQNSKKTKFSTSTFICLRKHRCRCAWDPEFGFKCVAVINDPTSIDFNLVNWTLQAVPACTAVGGGGAGGQDP